MLHKQSLKTARKKWKVKRKINSELLKRVACQLFYLIVKYQKLMNSIEQFWDELLSQDPIRIKNRMRD